MLTKRTTSVNTVPWVFATKVPWCATCFSTQESVRIGVKVANPRSRLVTGSRDTFSNTILITQLLKSSTHLANSNRPNTIIRLNKPTVMSNAGNGNSLLHRHHPLLNLPCRHRPLIWRELVHNGENLVKTSEWNLIYKQEFEGGKSCQIIALLNVNTAIWQVFELVENRTAWWEIGLFWRVFHIVG